MINDGFFYNDWIFMICASQLMIIEWQFNDVLSFFIHYSGISITGKQKKIRNLYHAMQKEQDFSKR
jgi:hypothetical protein